MMLNIRITSIMSKNFWKVLIKTIFVILSVGLISCSDQYGSGGASIVGTWVDGSTTMVLGSDGSYNMSNTSMSTTQYRKGTYSYNPSLGLMTINIVAVPGKNNAYQDTFIVQTLTATTLVLIYPDGDVEGYYTRKK